MAGRGASWALAERCCRPRMALGACDSRGETAKVALTEANLRRLCPLPKMCRRGMSMLDLIQKAISVSSAQSKNSSTTKVQVQHLRDVVDPTSHHPRHSGPGPNHPHSGSHGRDHQPADPTSRRLQQELGREPTSRGGAEMELDADRVREIIKISQNPCHSKCRSAKRKIAT